MERIKIKNFKKVLRTTQQELKDMVVDYLKEQKYKPTVGDGFVYGAGDIPILLVAHLDTVHKNLPTDIFFDPIRRVLWSPQGIGGDDRCGVYMIMKLLEKYKPFVLFTEDEEIGAIGADKAVKQLLAPKVKFIIELDRRGNKDCVFYDCGNDDFHKYIESFGFETAIGSFSDICTLSSAWDIASVNLSSGYYNEHTISETININVMHNTIAKVSKILEDKDEREFDYQEIVYNYSNYNYGYNNWGGYYSHNYTGYTSNEEFDDDEDALKEDEKQQTIYDYEDEYGYLDKDDSWHWWSEESYQKYQQKIDEEEKKNKKIDNAKKEKNES